MLSIGQAIRQDWTGEDGTAHTDYGVIVGIIFEWSQDYFACSEPGPWYAVRWDVIELNPDLAPHYNFVGGEELTPISATLLQS